jgi:perosamine synthetase
LRAATANVVKSLFVFSRVEDKLKRFFPVSQPAIGEKEIAYVTDAVRSGWVSSIGRYIEEFEKSFAGFCGSKFALAVSNGTTALHLALVSAGIKTDDEVIIPDLTFVATANAVTYTGARVVPVDIDSNTLCIDIGALESAITPRTRAIIPVHLYGHAAKMDTLMSVARQHRLIVIEDAAEAHGAEYKGRRVGSIGDCGVFSFYGNKVITSGEGGMITTDNADLYSKAKLLRDHAMSPQKRYWHTEIGFNYRMTNLQAALGVAQMERIHEFLEKRKLIMQWYRKFIGSEPELRLNYEEPDTKNVYWMICLEIAGLSDSQRSVLMSRLREVGVDTRPYFYPISDMPMYQRADTPVAHAISQRGINLPSYTDLTESDVEQICQSTKSVLQDMGIVRF